MGHIKRLAVGGADPRELAGYPVVHVVGAYVACHLGYGLPPGLGSQLERVLDPVGQPLDVERVAQDRLRQLDGGAGELAEHEGAAAAACLLDDEVLHADQVHAIDQRRDQQCVGERVVRGELPL